MSHLNNSSSGSDSLSLNSCFDISRLLRKSVGTKKNQLPLLNVLNVDDKYRDIPSFPSSAEYSSLQISTEDTDKSDKCALFQSLEHNSYISSMHEPKQSQPSTKFEGNNYGKRISYKKNRTKVKDSNIQGVFSNDTLDYVVERVEGLDIAEPQKVTF